MSETVIIFGAGASASAGAPLMNNFLDAADSLRKKEFRGDENFSLVFKGIDELQSALSKATVDLVNLESVFAAFEMASLLGRLGSLPTDQVPMLPNAMARVIQETLEDTIRFSAKDRVLDPPEPYNQIGGLLREFGEKHSNDFSAISLITFNYDVCLDYALHLYGIPFTYCLDARTTSRPRTQLRLLKLHGSLNWAKCRACHKIGVLRIAELLGDRLFSPSRAPHYKLSISKVLSRKNHCDIGPLSDEPFIAPPTWNKTLYHSQLESVWRSAAEELSDAENIIICGYSLPETDQFFRYLYALGSVGHSRLKRFWVINPDQAVSARFKHLCGQLAASRFQFFPELIENAIGRIAQVLGVPYREP